MTLDTQARGANTGYAFPDMLCDVAGHDPRTALP